MAGATFERADTTASRNVCGSVTACWRTRLAAGGLVLVWLAIMTRLVQLQGRERHALHDRVARQSLFSEIIPARPGEILDRCGRVLAMTETCDSLFAVPDQIRDPWHFAWQVGQALGLEADSLHRRLVEHSDRQFLWVKRRLTREEAQAVRSLGLPRSEWGLRREYQRRYPHGGFAAHVLGLRDIDNIGRGGLEQSQDEPLRGVDGRRVMTRDALGVIMEVAEERSRPPRHGQAVVTTLDLPIQMAAEKALDAAIDEWDPVGACAIVMEPRSGDILAMASRPAFDPTALNSVPDAAWKNLAVSAVFEPGSTFKPFVVAAAMQADLLQADEFIDCSFGAYRMGPRVLHDVHPYGVLSVEDVLVKSSNIGMARIAERMGLPALYETTRLFGFGRRTGVELPGEVSGIVRPLADWNGYSLGSIPMGQELAVTPLQLMTAHAALANGGRLVRPHLIHDPARFTVNPQIAARTVAPARDIGTQIVQESIARWIVSRPMHQVVERGTARSIRVPGLSIFGKTGTAQKADPKRGGYSDTATVLWFVCGAPASNPEVLVLVMVDEPQRGGRHFGGTVAGPVAVRILQETLPRVRELGFHRADPQLSFRAR